MACLLCVCALLLAMPAVAASPDGAAVHDVDEDDADERDADGDGGDDDGGDDGGDDADADDGIIDGSLRWATDARLGVSVGNVLLVPFVTPGPGAATSLSARLRFFRHVTVGADIGASFGLQFENNDPAPLVGYRGRLRFGLTGDVVDSLTLAGDLRLGLSSFALVPLPRYGLSGTITWRPVDAGWFIWDVRGDVDAELLVIAPAPGFGLSTGTTFRFGMVEAGFRAGVEGDAVLAILVNTAGVAVFLEGFLGARF
jgi:hypothetical protein